MLCGLGGQDSGHLQGHEGCLFLDLGGQVHLSFVHFSLSLLKDSPPVLLPSQGPASSGLPVCRGFFPGAGEALGLYHRWGE